MKYSEFKKEFEEIDKLPSKLKRAALKKIYQEEPITSETYVAALFEYAYVHLGDGRFVKTKKILNPIVLDYENYAYVPELISCFLVMASISQYEKNFELSVFYHGIALDLAKKHKARRYYCMVHNNLCLVKMEKGDLDGALESILKAEKEFKSNIDAVSPEMGGYLYLNMATCYLRREELEKAKKAFEYCVTTEHALEDMDIRGEVVCCGVTLYYKLNDLEKFSYYRQEFYGVIDEFLATEGHIAVGLEACESLLYYAMESKDAELEEAIFSRLMSYMDNHPEEYRIGARIQSYKYRCAKLKNDKEGMLQALEEKDKYHDKIIENLNIRNVEVIEKQMDINHRLRKSYRELEEAYQKLEVITEKANQANAAKTDFLSRMSHDIRTPINGIMGMLSIAKANYENKEQLEDCLHKMELSSEQLLSLISDVLVLSKLESGDIILERESFDLLELLSEHNELLDVQFRDSGVDFATDHSTVQNRRLIGSPVQLQRILFNLASNARKYTPAGGCVKAGTREVKVTDTQVFLEFKISDTGIGMSQEFIDNELFAAFSQESKDNARTEYRGVGLGMNIVKELVNKLNGTIQVTSTKGKGSTFTVTLPFDIDFDYVEKEAKATVDSIKGLHFLVAKDNEINLEILKFFLEEEGASFDCAANGKEALDLFAKSTGHYYDGILMDVRMPEMDGLEATRRIRALDREDAKKVLIFAVSANSFAEDAELSKAAGMDDHINKPVDINVLVSKVLRFINNQ